MKQSLGMAGIIVLGLAAFFGARHWQERNQEYLKPEMAVGCELQYGSCRQALDAGAVTFAIDPPEVPLMKTLSLTVATERIPAVEGVVVEIRGLNMEMGLNRTVMQRDAEGRWRGETILPICSQRRMEWEAVALIDATVGIAVPFLFYTERP
jgi:hypothetical protein